LKKSEDPASFHNNGLLFPLGMTEVLLYSFLFSF
jgi:hypothetical protein